MCLVLMMTFSFSILNAQDTAKDEVGELIYHSIDEMLDNYPWWRTPSIYYNVTTCIGSSCGALCSASYCPTNEVIAVPNTDVNTYFEFGDAALAFVIAHEMGHHIQYLRREFYSNLPSGGESEADCAGGALIGSLVRNEYITLSQNDDSEMVNLAWNIGDYCGDTVHGTPEERVGALERGLDLGLQHSFEVAFNQCVNDFK